MINKKHSATARQNIKKVNEAGLNVKRGAENGNYRNGSRVSGNHPCPKCGVARICDKRDASRLCKKCFYSREKQFDLKKWGDRMRKASKAGAVAYLGGKCIICGAKDLPPCCYHFHHRNPATKSFTLGQKFNQKLNKRIFAELDKCDLLCANCNSIETWHY